MSTRRRRHEIIETDEVRAALAAAKRRLTNRQINYFSGGAVVQVREQRCDAVP
jgi:archaeosine-15-forming tRNA-guanine transglycosylase